MFRREYYLLAVFYLVLLFSIFKGDGANLRNSFFTARELFYYIISFVVLNSIKSKKEINAFANTVLWGVSIYIFEIFSIYVWKSNPLRSLLSMDIWDPTRIAFSNHGIFLFSAPLGLILAFTAESKQKKSFSFLIFIASLILVVFSQTRVLYICLVLGLIICFLLFFIKNKKFGVNFAPIIFGIIAFLFLAAIVLPNIKGGTSKGSLAYSVEKRLGSFTSLNFDDSVRFREKQMVREIEKVKKYFWFGQGMRSFYKDFYLGSFENIFWDNSISLFIRKVGFLGFILLMGFIIWVGSGLFFCYRYSSEKLILAITISLISMIPGFFIRLFTEPFLIQWKIVFFYAILLGLVQAMAILVKAEINNKKEKLINV